MNIPFSRKYAVTFVGATLVAVAYWLAQFPETPAQERAVLAAQFKFQKLQMPEVAERPAYKSVRQVHPSLQRISAWISSLGAAVTLADLDRDGLPNDLCFVDPRTDLVTVAPAPGTGERYAPFVLNPAPLPYDAATTAPMGSVAGDFNEDGMLDVLVYFWGRTPVIYLRKEGAKLALDTFHPVELTSAGERWFSNGATQADLDGDGHVDIIIGNYFQDGARILDAKATGVEVMHAGKAKALNGGQKHVFLWKGGGKGAQPGVQFAEVKNVFPEHVNRGWTLSMAAADLDGDQLPEIYFGHDFGPDRLLHNRSTPGNLKFGVLEGKRHFTTPKSCVINHDSFKGMGADFGDVNGDGMLDIYVSNIATKFGLTESHFLWLSTGNPAVMKEGVAPYEHGSEKLGLSRSGWGWESRLADFNNDGVLEAIQGCGFLKGKVNRWPELQALGTSNDRVIHNPGFWPNFKPGADLSGHDHNPFFVRTASGRYEDISAELALDTPMVTKAIGTADVDGDGRLDFAVGNQWEQSFFFRNESAQPGAFLGLHLLVALDGKQTEEIISRAGHPDYTTPARPAIGASVAVYLAEGRKLVSFVDGGAGHSGRRSPDVHFGLGKENKQPVRVELKWRGLDGRARQGTVSLAPGWHTVILGNGPQTQTASTRD